MSEQEIGSVYFKSNSNCQVVLLTIISDRAERNSGKILMASVLQSRQFQKWVIGYPTRSDDQSSPYRHAREYEIRI